MGGCRPSDSIFGDLMPTSHPRVRRTPRILAWMILAVILVTVVSNYLIPFVYHTRQMQEVNQTQGSLVAKANGEEFRSKAVAARLRSLLWRRGESWKALSAAERKSRCEDATDRLIDEFLLARF